MPTPSDRERQVLRLMHGGVKLVSHGTSIGHLTLTCPTTVNATTVKRLLACGWIQFDEARDLWIITDDGRDIARTQDFVHDFTHGAP